MLYAYDALNRLTEVRRKSSNQIMGQYGYDAQNRRARKTVSNGGLSGNIPSGTIDFIYKDWQVMEERTGSTVNKQYVWGDYVDECIQLRTYVVSGAGSLPAGLYYPLQDLLYRTKALTDSSGEIVEAYDYDPYGNTLIFSEAGAEDNWWSDDATQADYAACEVLYAGYRYDAESKTYQVRNRQYNPALGRWIQRDPIGFDGGDWNLYGYVSNNPTNTNDSDGLLALVAGVAVLVVVVIAGITYYYWTHKRRECSPKPPAPPEPDPCKNIGVRENCEECNNNFHQECIDEAKRSTANPIKKIVRAGSCRHVMTACGEYCIALGTDPVGQGQEMVNCWKTADKIKDFFD